MFTLLTKIHTDTTKLYLYYIRMIEENNKVILNIWVNLSNYIVIVNDYLNDCVLKYVQLRLEVGL